jgi:hypothetical protein
MNNLIRCVIAFVLGIIAVGGFFMTPHGSDNKVYRLTEYLDHNNVKYVSREYIVSLAEFVCASEIQLVNPFLDHGIQTYCEDK